MSLRKGATFHSPTTPEPEVEHHFKLPALPRRSQTTLEDVVDAHKRRVALTLGDIDRGLSAAEDRSPTARQSFRDEADPLPQTFLDHTLGSPTLRSYGSIMDSAVDQPPSPAVGRRSARLRHTRRSSKFNDSALGSSIDTTPAIKTEEGTSVAPSAINMGAAAHSSTMKTVPRLSDRASNRIREHILRPLLAKKSLKDFNDIVRECPGRIHKKEIICLRDLEKTLMFSAPSKTKTVALYLDFCLTSIRCIQATVEFLSEREQTRPNDRPYTNGYFVDLVDQIKQYARQIQAAKDRESKGDQLGEMDFDPTDEVKLHGGLAKNGRPAELVRIQKNGKAISMATGKPVDLDEDSKEGLRFKRSLSEEAEEDEAIRRSMARRKRSASASELAPKRCREPGCDKEFKRPCDLTKHEKTHSRPWKCPVESCKYHEHGWPTEKEMDRHHNDKHSAAPPLFKCRFENCKYASKRESNCKQHMEKAHGWTYVRSKNNGKNRNKSSTAPSIVHGSLPTPATDNIRTPSSNGDLAGFGDDLDDLMKYGPPSGPSILDSNENDFPTYNYNDSEMLNFPQTINIDFSPVSEQLNQFSSSEQSPFSEYAEYQPNQTHFDEQFPTAPTFGTNGADFNLFEGEDLYGAPVHLPTPQPEQFSRFFDSSCVDTLAQFSPAGNPSHTLYTPKSMREDNFDDLTTSCDMNMPDGDFQLFPNFTSGTVSSSAPSGLFGEINPMYPGANAKELLDFYTRSTTVAITTHQNPLHSNNNTMDWSSDQYINI
jgi:uncharacterized C2H2 Zn-finger protein